MILLLRDSKKDFRNGVPVEQPDEVQWTRNLCQQAIANIPDSTADVRVPVRPQVS